MGEEKVIKKTKKKKSREDRIVDAVVWICLIIVLLLTAYPFYYVVVASFSDGYDFMRGGVYLWPRVFTLDNYKNLLGQKIWINAFIVSFIRTIVGTFLTVCMTCLVSYTLSRKELMFGKIYRFLVVFAMYVSGGLIPYYIVLKNLHLINTFWVYVIPSMLNLFFIIVGMNFFGSIPTALIESAKLDGASELRVLIRIVMPISTPSYYVNTEALRTVAYRMLVEINQSTGAAITGGTIATKSTTLTTQATAMVTSMLPIMCVYPFLQKYFVQGLMIGAVKE